MSIPTERPSRAELKKRGTSRSYVSLRFISVLSGEFARTDDAVDVQLASFPSAIRRRASVECFARECFARLHISSSPVCVNDVNRHVNFPVDYISTQVNYNLDRQRYTGQQLQFTRYTYIRQYVLSIAC